MNDLTLACRRLLKSPGFTGIAALTLALGVGLNTAIFTAVRAAWSRPLPYPEGDRLVQIFGTSSRSTREHLSPANFLDLRDQSRDFDFLATFTSKPVNLAEPGQPAERVEGLLVSADFFPLLGVAPELGRMFNAEEDRPHQNQVVILDHPFWKHRFAGDPSIIGRPIRLDGEWVTVVGVMPAHFHDLMLAGPVSLWRPIAFTDDERTRRGHHYLKSIGRLKSGVTQKHAQAGLKVIAARLSQEHPDENATFSLRSVPLAEAPIPTEGRVMLGAIMALAGCVLLIACANLANLQFARTATRGRELAIRGALGAPRFRVVRQLLTESLLLAGLGGVLGLIVAWLASEALRRLLVFEGESPLNLAIDWRVLGFALVASASSGLAFGLMPAWLASRVDVHQALKQGARGTTRDRSQHRWEHSLIVLEIALALILLTGAGLLVNGLRAFSSIHPGWGVDGLTVGQLTLPAGKYPDAPAQRLFAERLEQRLTALPGVEKAAVCWNPPLRQFNVTTSFSVDGRPPAEKGHGPIRYLNGVSSDYFDTLGMRLLQGRSFRPSDTTEHPDVVVINESMARAFWPDLSPIGQRINGEEIVGVVNDVRFPANPASARTPFQAYRPLSQSPNSSLAIVVRGSVAAETLRRSVADLDPDQPLARVRWAREDVGDSIENWSIGGKLLSAFAILGISLAALGVYGVISGFVTRRTGEIGVRMALGAQLGDVLWLVLSQGLRVAFMGAGIGLVGAMGMTRLLASVLPGLPATHPGVLASTVAILLGVVLLACCIPARRAARVDPIEALRLE